MSTLYDDPLAGRRKREAVQTRWTRAYAPARHVDPVVALVALVLSLVALVFIYSATQPRVEAAGVDEMYYVNRQLLSLGLGVVAMVVTAAVDYRVLRLWAPVLYVVSLLLLGAVMMMGDAGGGAVRWITIAGFQFQPAELAKPALIVALAAHFHERRESALGLRALIEALVLAAIPMGLIVLQPDLGTAMVFVAITFGVLLVARVRVRYLAALALIGVVGIAGLLQTPLIQDYQLERLATFLHPEAADAQGDAWNLTQAQIAIGSGQLTGQGLFQGTQTRLAYVPENHTDFIFTVLAEETGFLGAAVLLALYALLLTRAIRIAASSRDTFGALLAAGIITVFAFQIFINIGMSLGMMPITGLPLPFLSYGGTSLIGTFLMIGILQSVHMRRFQ